MGEGEDGSQGGGHSPQIAEHKHEPVGVVSDRESADDPEPQTKVNNTFRSLAVFRVLRFNKGIGFT